MRRAHVEDATLAGVVLLLAQSDVWFPVLTDPSLPGPDGLIAASYAVTSIAVAFRRRAPFSVMVLVLAITAGWALVYGATEGPGSLVPVLVAIYSVARHGTRRQSMWTMAAILTVVITHEANNPDTQSWRDLANALAWDLTLPSAWLLGSWLRARGLYERSLAEAAVRTEEERAARDVRSAERAAERERVRIAHELHDVVAHGVSLMVLQASAAEVVLERDPNGAAKHLRQVDRAGREALSELRRLLGVLKTGDAHELAPQPGITALDELVETMCTYGLRVELESHGTAVPVPPGVDLTAYRVVQESLTNVARHARARSVSVELSWTATALDIEVVDDGRGRTESGTPHAGHGLDGMRARVELCGGSLATGNRASGGFGVHVSLPLDAAA